MTQVRETLAGRYELGEVLGRGGMGVVYRATDRVLDRSVAVKMLPADLAADPTFVTRFKREALAAAALNHPNIVSIYDSGSDEDIRFIVMECVPGRSLARLLADEGCLEPAQAVDIATQVAAALAAAHRAGVIHRDIKPANVMVDDDGRVKVLDFGIARAASHTTLTQHDVILGSAPYLAPEVTKGLPADARSDIYALGCVLYAMLTGDPPFSGELPAAIMHQHIAAAPRPLRELSPAIPPQLDAFVLEMLAKDPAQRPQRAAQVVRALPDTLREEATATQPLPTRVMAGSEPSQFLDPPEPAPARRLVGPLLIGLALATVVAVVALAAGGGGARRAAHKGRAAAHRASTTARTSRPVTARLSTTQQPAAPAPSVAGASASLASLLARDVAGGTADQPAANQILNTVRDALRSYDDGNAADALNHVGALPAQIAQLQNSGDVQSAAVAPLDAAVGALQSALERGAPSASGAGSGQSAAAPPPGQGPPPGGGDGKGPKPKGPKKPKGHGGDGGD